MIHNLDSLEPAILYGIVNEKLRLECQSLADFVLKFEVDEKILIEKMDSIDFCYDPDLNQFRPR